LPASIKKRKRRRKENLTLDGRKALKALLSANKRLNTAYVLKESFGQLWSYERDPLAASSSHRRRPTAGDLANDQLQVLAGLRPLPAKEFQILVFQFVGRHEKFSGRVVEFDEIRKPLRTLDKQVQALSFRPNTDWRHSKLGAAAPVGMIMVRRFNRTNRTEG